MKIAAHIVVLDGDKAVETVGALGLRRQNPEDRSGNAHADSRERIGRKPGDRYRYDPLKHTGGRNFDGIDDPSPDDDMPQFTPDEEFDGPEDSPSRAIAQHPALRTVDNIQVYRASQRFMYDENAGEADPHNLDPNHLEYWMERPQEKLDAIIIPSNVGPLAYEKIEKGLARVKQAHPWIKVIQISRMPMAQPPLVDVLLVDPTARQISDATRDAIGMPRLPGPDPDLMQKLNLEANRERALKMGRYTVDSLPPWLRMPGDPGYEPPGGKDGSNGDGKGRRGRG